jgi:NAD(P)-dependent dehydrogenase (short-subunit alcohol dehydrogenase family)
MHLGIEGLKVLVTAGANGIGLSIAKAFESEGAKVHICDVDDEALPDVAGVDAKITSSKTDVSDREQVGRLFEEALDRLGGLDALINNAGISGPHGRG